MGGEGGRVGEPGALTEETQAALAVQRRQTLEEEPRDCRKFRVGAGG